MCQFYKPRPFSAIFCALLYFNYSLASPIGIFPNQPSLNPYPLRKDGTITSATEPVHIIPIDTLPPGYKPGDGASGATNDGTTLSTTYKTTPRDLVQSRPSNPVTSATEPVHIIPHDQLPPGYKPGGGVSSKYIDGNTLVTVYNTSGSATNKRSNPTTSLDLVNTTNAIPIPSSDFGLGLNCQGSVVMCVGASQMGVMHTLRDYMYAIPHGYHYYTGQKIACMKHEVYPSAWFSWGFYCAFMQGNITPEGVDGAEIQLKMQQMIEHNCLGCGSVPISDDNDPNIAGILTVNYVRQSECEGLCYYVPPGGERGSVKVPEGMHLVQ